MHSARHMRGRAVCVCAEQVCGPRPIALRTLNTVAEPSARAVDGVVIDELIELEGTRTEAARIERTLCRNSGEARHRNKPP